MHVLICPLHNVLRCYSYRVVFQSYKVWVLPASFFCHVTCPFLFISVSSNMRLKCTYSLTFRICDLWNVVLTINLSLIVLLSKIFYIFSPRAQLAGGGGLEGRDLPVFICKLKQSALFWGIKALIVLSMG